MNKARHFLFNLVLFAAAAAPLMACVSEADDGSQSEDDELKKKVKPKGGNGAFELGAPSFSTTGFAGTFSFDNQKIVAGERRDKVPGSYWLQGSSDRFDQGQVPGQQLQLAITAGTVTRHVLGGLRVRFDRPVTLGGVAVSLTPERGLAGNLLPNGTWRSNANGASMLALAGKIAVGTATENAPIDAIVSQGQLAEVVLPTSRAVLALDPLDPDYPTPTTCDAPLIRAGAWGNQEATTLRKSDGSSNGPFVVPSGSRTTLRVETYGLITERPATAGQTQTFTLNRLEVDDVEVMDSSGSSRLVRGTFTVSSKSANGTLTPLNNCAFPTHSGIDLPDGTYVVVSTANSSSGVIRHTEEVSFP